MYEWGRSVGRAGAGIGRDIDEVKGGRGGEGDL